MPNFAKLTADGKRCYRYASRVSFHAGAGLLGAFAWRFPVPELRKAEVPHCPAISPHAMPQDPSLTRQEPLTLDCPPKNPSLGRSSPKTKDQRTAGWFISALTGSGNWHGAGV